MRVTKLDMSDIERSALINYSAKQMYDLVNDVARYAEFLPGCVSSKVVEQTEKQMLALMELKKGPVSQTFTTRNDLIGGKSSTMELQDGPCEYLHGVWSFRELSSDACKVELDLSFKFKNKLAAVAFSQMFNDLTSKLVDSFVARAEVIYGG